MKKAKRSLEKSFSAEQIVGKLLFLSQTQKICLLDSCNVSHLGSHLLICGFDALETFEISHADPRETLDFLDRKISDQAEPAIFTISYNFGLKLENIKPSKKTVKNTEPDVFLAVFPCLLIHDYSNGESFLYGDDKYFDKFEQKLLESQEIESSRNARQSKISSNFTKPQYIGKIKIIKEFIRRGESYQTNLTQQITAELPENLTPQMIFQHLRRNHPAPFASFIQRSDSTIISASPERFFKINSDNSNKKRLISTSPIKGTRPRGKDLSEDLKLQAELLNSEKDRAENVMIVDLLRNDLGKICEFGTVIVEKLCDLEQHSTLFHLVSTILGKLREDIKFSDIIKAVFPCGSITGAPKISTMRIIERLENAHRGLSMGAIGYSIPRDFNNLESNFHSAVADLSVAIRTMTIKNRRAIFNVGGGIVIDSEPEDEFAETEIKAKALVSSINGDFL